MHGAMDRTLPNVFEGKDGHQVNDLDLNDVNIVNRQSLELSSSAEL